MNSTIKKSLTIKTPISRSNEELLIKIQKRCGEVPEEWRLCASRDDDKTFKKKVKEFMKVLDAEKTGKDGESVWFPLRLYGDQICTVNIALDVMAKIAGTSKSRSYLMYLMAANFLSQFAEDGTGHVESNNAFIFESVEGLIKQIDFSQKDAADLLIGIISAGIERNTGTK